MMDIGIPPTNLPVSALFDPASTVSKNPEPASRTNPKSDHIPDLHLQPSFL
jgi:hypothetical protein